MTVFFYWKRRTLAAGLAFVASSFLGTLTLLNPVCSLPTGPSTPPRHPQPTQSLGAFITPVDAKASSSQDGAGRTPHKLIDGSGWGETRPGSGVYTHTGNVYADGNCMWNGDWNSWLVFDLGKPYRVNGFYVWNYNETGLTTRGVKEIAVSASSDGLTFVPVGTFTLNIASGAEDDCGQALAFPRTIPARFLKWQILSNYRGGEQSGLSEVRFSNAQRKAAATAPVVWKPKYPRPAHPKTALGKPLPGAENIMFPQDSGVVNVALPPYNAKGDGRTDDTAAIQKALDDNTDKGAILYLPNGLYRVSDTLRWGGNEGQQRNTVLWGQSRRGTVIQLRDACPGFDQPRRPKGVVYTGHAPAQRFGNEIHNLTVDTGLGNPGACGIQFIANNQGGVYDVSIVSGDGQGIAGLDMGYTNEQGPCLIKNVGIVGFDFGVRVDTSVASETLEHITVAHQNKAGFFNGGQPCTVRDLRSVNEVPAFQAASGFNVLIDCVFQGIGRASSRPAVINDATMMARSLQTSGYKFALENHASGGTRRVAGPNVGQFLSRPGASLFGPPDAGLSLPIRETPEIPWDALRQWAAPQKFIPTAGSGADDSDAIQKAIDSGATTVYLPRGAYHLGHTIILRGNVRRLVGCKAFLIPIAPLNGQSAPLLRLAEGAAATVTVEGINTDFSGGPYFFVEHAAKRTLVLRRLEINFQAADAYHSTGTGDIFIEDVVGRYFQFHHQRLWARQFNPEGDGLHILNDGGTAWILGLKTEGGGTLVQTQDRGRTEILGGFCYAVGNIDQTPMFVIDNADASLSFAEVCYTGKPFSNIVRETQNEATRRMTADDPTWESAFTLFSAHHADAKK